MMRIPRPRLRNGRLRLPRRTARLRLTVLYGAAFLVCGGAALAIVAYLLYSDAAHPSPSNPAESSASASAVLHSQVPVTDVQQAGSYDIVKIPVKIPIADVQRAGSYDKLNVSDPFAVSQRQKLPTLSAAEVANLASRAKITIDYDIGRILVISGIGLAVIAVAAAAIGWIIAGRVLRPLRTINAAARRISASSLHERLAMHGPDDELKELADTLDNLFARLEASFDAQRRFAANASHELRTPLTRERTLLQVTLADPASTPGSWQAVSRELLASNAEQEHLIEALLTLASSETGTGDRKPADLAAITSAALAAARPAIRGLNLHADMQPAALDADPVLIQQLAGNLIDNAIRHNIPGGDILISTKTSQGHAVLSVTNSGQVIPAGEVDRLFQPFQRLGSRPARRDGGHGLGLSIVRAIATAHAATVSAQPRPGGGLAIDVTFPPPLKAPPQNRRPQAGRPARV
jgi:signal transduction histidine kinase